MMPVRAALAFLLLGPLLAAQTGSLADALAAKQGGRHEEAAQQLAQLAAREPDNAEVLFHLGTVQGWLGRYDEALATFTRGLALAPHDTDMRIGYGRVLAWSGKLAPAEAVFREVLQREPQNLEALNMLGRILTWRRQFDRADQTYANILALAGNNTDALIGRGDILRLQERFREARSYYAQALAIEPDSADVRKRLESVKSAGVWRADFGAEYSWFSGSSRDDWYGFDAALRYAVNARTGVSLAVERAHRFGVEDTQLTAGLDRRFSDAWSGYLRLSGTPRADFFAENLAAGGLAWRVRAGDESWDATVLLVDARAARYAPGTATSWWLGATQYLNGRLAVTAKALFTRNLNARWTEGWMLRLDGEPAEHWRWHLGFADSTESLSSTVFDFTRNLRTRSFFGGAGRDFSSTLGLRIDLTHERTEGGPDRQAIHLGAVTRF